MIGPIEQPHQYWALTVNLPSPPNEARWRHLSHEVLSDGGLRGARPERIDRAMAEKFLQRGKVALFDTKEAAQAALAQARNGEYRRAAEIH